MYIQSQLEILNARFKTTQSRLNALEKIGKFGSPYDAKYIIKYIFSTNEPLAKKTSQIIKKLLTKKEMQTSWLNLYNHFSFNAYDTPFDLHNINKIKNFPAQEAVYLYGIASLNCNGYVRQKALNHLQNFPPMEILPYILLRLNDWVDPIQKKAQEIILKISPLLSATHILPYYYLIEWLSTTKRVQLTHIQQTIFAQINASQHRDALFLVMEKASVKEKLFCWKTLAKHMPKESDLIDKAISDSTAEIRQWVAQYLPKDAFFKKRLTLLATDKAIRVRHAAFKSLAQEEPKLYEELYHKALFDNSKSIREYARFALKSCGIDDFREKYQKEILAQKNTPNIGAIIGLAEISTKEDTDWLKKFVNHHNKKVRAAILFNLHRLDDENIEPLCLAALQDKSKKVIHISLCILNTKPTNLESQLKLLLQNENINIQKTTLNALQKKSNPLDKLKYILYALKASAKETQKMAWLYLENWYRKYNAQLWFSYKDELYEQIVKLLEDLEKTNIQPPYHICKIWKDLPNIIALIKKK